MKLSPAGDVVARLGRNLLSTPVRMKLDAWGNLWITDNGVGRVVELSPTGGQLAAFGSIGSALGQLRGPRGIALDPHRQRLRRRQRQLDNDRVQKLSPKGRSRSEGPSTRHSA